MATLKRTPLRIMRSVVFALVLREMRTRFGSRRMGAFWMLFEPVMHILFMVFMFSVIRNRHVPGMDYPIYFLTGMVPFFLMRNISLKMMDAVEANKALFAYPNIKPFDTFVARTIVEFSLWTCVYVLILLSMGMWLGYSISIAYPLQWFGALAVGIAYSFGVGLVLCVVVEAMPNSKSFIRLIFMPLYFISGVIFPVWMIPTQYLPWLLWNPYLHMIDNIRSAVFPSFPVTSGISHEYPIAITSVTLFLGLALYRLRRRELLAI